MPGKRLRPDLPPYPGPGGRRIARAARLWLRWGIPILIALALTGAVWEWLVR